MKWSLNGVTPSLFAVERGRERALLLPRQDERFDEGHSGPARGTSTKEGAEEVLGVRSCEADAFRPPEAFAVAADRLTRRCDVEIADPERTSASSRILSRSAHEDRRPT
jgi:hypothetical protein